MMIKRGKKVGRVKKEYKLGKWQRNKRNTKKATKLIGMPSTPLDII